MHGCMEPMTGRLDLTTLEGPARRAWRNIFEVGFNSSHRMTQVSDMIQRIMAFCKILRDRAAIGEVFPTDL